jgi:hypothetical protein
VFSLDNGIRLHHLYSAFSMIGFAGIQCKEIPEIWVMSPCVINGAGCLVDIYDEIQKITIPTWTKIRFKK